MELKTVIEQRKTIKTFDPTVKISRAELEEMMKLAFLAPSKANLQPWRFVVIDDEETKKKLAPTLLFNALPCETASAVVLVLADLQYQLLLDDILDYAVENKCLNPEFKARSKAFLQHAHEEATAEQLRDQVLVDSSLAAMQLMLIAKDRGFDTHAIGIFDRPAALEVLKVDANRYVPAMFIAIGKAATNPIPSVRLPLEYTLSWNNGQGFKK